MYREETSIENIDTDVVKDLRVKEYGGILLQEKYWIVPLYLGYPSYPDVTKKTSLYVTVLFFMTVSFDGRLSEEIKMK